MKMKHILTCLCETEIECEPEDMTIGSVYRCPGCQQVWGNVRPVRGSNAWIRISDEDAEFHRLLDKPETDT